MLREMEDYRAENIDGVRPGEGERIGTFPNGAPMLRYNVSTPWASMDGDWEVGPHYAGTSAALVHQLNQSPIFSRVLRPTLKRLLDESNLVDHLTAFGGKADITPTSRNVRL